MRAVASTAVFLAVICLSISSVLGGDPAPAADPAVTQAPVPAAVPTAAPPVRPAPVLGEGKGTVTLTWDEFVKITGYDPTKKGGQVLTVPWKDVEALLGVELKGQIPMNQTMVDLPWGDFKSLLEWSVRKKADIEAPPPTDFILTSSEYKGEIGADAATFTLKLNINVLRKDGWKRIAALPAGVALTKSTLPKDEKGKAMMYLNSVGGAYELLTDKSGEMPVELEFTVNIVKNAGINTVSFDRTLASAAIVDLTFGGEDLDVKVSGAQSMAVVNPDKAPDKKKHVTAALPTGANIAITWERALPKVAAAPTRLYAETRTLAAVTEGAMICEEALDFNILHTPLRELLLTVPKGVSVLGVNGPNVQDWRSDGGLLTVTLRGEIIGPTSLRVSYEAPIAQLKTATAAASSQKTDVPVLRTAPSADKWVGAEREKGYVGVIALSNVEIDAADVDGATVIDVKDLPAEITAMTKQPILLGFRYAGDKFSIPLTIKKHAEVSVLITIVDSALFTTMQLDDGRRMTRAIYTVRNNRNQFLRMAMPAGAEIWSAAVSGSTVSPAADEQKNVLIPLIRSAAASQELASFPVEIVYVETPAQAAPGAGRLRVALPTLAGTPAMHVMVNYYAPAEGKYGKPGGWFTPAESGFAGTLRLVGKFAEMTADKGAAVATVDVQKQAQEMQKQFETKMETTAKEAGVTPIRVRLPIDGKLFKLEKILALPGDELYFTVDYSDWKAAK